MNEILLVVRAQIVREGLQKLLTEASFSVIGEAATPDDALKFIDHHQGQEISLIVSEAAICYETPGFLKSVRHAAPKARIVILANQEMRGASDIGPSLRSMASCRLRSQQRLWRNR
jgi:DNA-binding NarL/FixJ family response regulator